MLGIRIIQVQSNSYPSLRHSLRAHSTGYAKVLIVELTFDNHQILIQPDFRAQDTVIPPKLTEPFLIVSGSAIQTFCNGTLGRETSLPFVPLRNVGFLDPGSMRQRSV